jgi:hypothetical protein
MDKKQQHVEARIAELKAELTALGRMRPGSLSKQARTRGGGYFQVSYSRAGRLHCDYVRPDYEPVVRAEIQTYRRYRELTRLWVDLELELSMHRQRLAAGEQGDP